MDPQRKFSVMQFAFWIGKGLFILFVAAFAYHSFFYWPIAEYSCTTKQADGIVHDRLCTMRSMLVMPFALRASAIHKYDRDFGSQ